MKLEGINAISNYLRLTESTVMDLILRQNLPATKDQQSATWSAESGAVDKWMSGGKKPAAKKAKKSGKPQGEAKKVVKKDGDRKVK